MMEWISVKESLPEYGVHVLMLVANDCEDCIKGTDHVHKLDWWYKPIMIGHYCEKDHNAESWYKLFPDKRPEGSMGEYKDWWSPMEPTHWMLIPKIPDDPKYKSGNRYI